MKNALFLAASLVFAMPALAEDLTFQEKTQALSALTTSVEKYNPVVRSAIYSAVTGQPGHESVSYISSFGCEKIELGRAPGDNYDCTLQVNNLDLGGKRVYPVGKISFYATPGDGVVMVSSVADVRLK